MNIPFCHWKLHTKHSILSMLMMAMFGTSAQAALVPSFSSSISGSTNSLTLYGNINIATADAVQNGNMYVAFLFNDVAYFSDGTRWIPYFGGMMPIYTVGPLANRIIEIVRDADMSPLIGGQLLVGYGLTERDMMVNRKYAMVFTTVADTTAPTVSGTIHVNGAQNVPINTKVGATFSEAMNASTLTPATFFLTQGTTPVAGTIAYTGVSAVFTPTNKLAYNTVYTVHVTTGAKDLAGNPLANNFTISWTTGDVPDITPPKVTLTSNANGSYGVPINTKVGVTFNEGMDPLTISSTSFVLKQTGGSPVVGTVSYSGVSAIFSPTNTLNYSSNYTATINTGAKDLAGNAIEKDYVWSWTTADYCCYDPPADTTPPTVTSVIQANGAINIATNTSLGVTFSESMNPLSITNLSFALKGTLSNTPVTGTVSYSGLNATFIPLSTLASNTGYTVTIKGGGAGVKDLAGNPLATDYVTSWTTAAAVDVTPPTVTGTVNTNGAVNVAVNSTAGATFSEALDPLSVTNATFTLKETVSGNAVAGTVSYSGVNAVFTPTSNLTSSLGYTATIKGGITGVKDLASNPLAADSVWSWTTAGHGPVAIDLLTAGTFTILTKTGVTDVPTSPITGNVGASAITGAAIVISCAEMLTGKIYEVDAGFADNACVAAGLPATNKTLVDNAVADMGTAYTAAAGRAAGTGPFLDVGAGTLTNQTLVPGVYTFGSGVLIPTNLTLAGGPNDVWVFQISGTLDLAANKQILLTGGAVAKNIFWQVTGATTLAAGSHFEGTILDFTKIDMLAGATITGRLLAQTAVNLDHSTVTPPAP